MRPAPSRKAVDKSGLSVTRIRYGCVLFAGFMASLAGAFLSIGDIHTFTEGMTRGAGYLAIASVIFGKWRIGGTVLACLLFGAATALQFQLAGARHRRSERAADHAALFAGAARGRRIGWTPDGTGNTGRTLPPLIVISKNRQSVNKANDRLAPIVFSNSGSGRQVLQRASLPGPLFSPR